MTLKNPIILNLILNALFFGAMSGQMYVDWNTFLRGTRVVANKCKLNSTKGLQNYSSLLNNLNLAENELRNVDEIKFLTKLTLLDLSSNQIECIND